MKKTNQRLTEENNRLRNNITELNLENQRLKRQKNIDENNFNTERKKLKEKITNMNDKYFQNTKTEKNLNAEILHLKEINNNIINENEKLKYIKEKVSYDLIKMEDRLIQENIELKQLNVIQYYIHKEIKPGNYDKNKYIKNIFLKELENIKSKYGLIIDSNKFIEIALYNIQSKLTENLTDAKTNKIFSNPIIKPDGKTYENTLNKSNDYIENKLVLKICNILKESKGKLKFDDIKKIKKLLISNEAGNYYKKPIVIISGKNKGETIEDIDEVNIGIKNKVIKNII